jgi:hypothetical protein
LTELPQHKRELASSPAEWMPWNYRQTLERAGDEITWPERFVSAVQKCHPKMAGKRTSEGPVASDFATPTYSSSRPVGISLGAEKHSVPLFFLL